MSACVQRSGNGKGGKRLMALAYPPASTRNAAIVCVRREPPGPISEMFPSAPAAPYSKTATGMSRCIESMLYTSYSAAPSGSRRLQATRRFMRSYRSTKLDANSEPVLSWSMNGMPVFTMLSRPCVCACDKESPTVLFHLKGMTRKVWGSEFR